MKEIKYPIPKRILLKETERSNIDNYGYYLGEEFIEDNDERAIGLTIHFKILNKIPESIIKITNKDYLNEEYFRIGKKLSAYPFFWENNVFWIALYGTHNPSLSVMKKIKQIIQKEIIFEIELTVSQIKHKETLKEIERKRIAEFYRELEEKKNKGERK